MFKPTGRRKPDRLLQALDQELGFENKISSRITAVERGYDKHTGEYVIWIQYRTTVQPGVLKETPKSRRVSLLHALVSDIK